MSDVRCAPFKICAFKLLTTFLFIFLFFYVYIYIFFYLTLTHKPSFQPWSLKENLPFRVGTSSWAKRACGFLWLPLGKKKRRTLGNLRQTDSCARRRWGAGGRRKSWKKKKFSTLNSSKDRTYMKLLEGSKHLDGVIHVLQFVCLVAVDLSWSRRNSCNNVLHYQKEQCFVCFFSLFFSKNKMEEEFKESIGYDTFGMMALLGRAGMIQHNIFKDGRFDSLRRFFIYLYKAW